MTIEFTDSTASDYIKWTAPSGVVGLTVKSLIMWYLPDTTTASGSTLWTIFDGTGTDSDEYNYFAHISGGKLSFFAHWSTTNGTWTETTASMIIGSVNHIAFTYNGGAAANNALCYTNGASSALTRTSTPAGTYRNGASTDFYISTPLAGLNPDGKILSCCYYNRILSASEIADAYASKLAIPTRNGLVFAPQLHQRGEVGEGGILTASRTIADAVSGALGTPSGSPLHKQDNFLRYE